MDFLVDLLGSGGGGVLGGVLGIIAFFLMIAFLKSIIKVELPDTLLVVTGRKRTQGGKNFGFSVERGRTIKVPYFQSVQHLDLGVFPINVRVEGVNSANGITVGADATACVCIDDDDEGMLYAAVERLMGKDRRQIHDQIQQTLIGNFRGALNKATPLAAIGMTDTYDDDVDQVTDASQALEHGERAQFRQELLTDIDSDLSSFGMKVVSVSLQKIWDTSNYIANLAQKTLAQKRQQVEIEEARLRALADKAESDAERLLKLARSKADEQIIAVRQKLEVYRRESVAQIEQARLEAIHGIEEATNRGEREVQNQLIELQKLQNQSKVTLIADAQQKSAQILSEGEEESVNLVEGARNDLLRQKVEMMAQAGQAGTSVLFVQQQLPRLFEAYKKYAEGMSVDSLVVMDDDTGFNGAVNRGPAAFVDFLLQFNKALGVDVRSFLEGKEAQR
ncbi:MAG: flotillin family protein [Spirochaetales bacterium]|nr:MAG: flotillin family protein [Spirochaetales bacterium]